MSRFQFVKPIARKGGLLSGYTGDPSGIWSLRQRYELLTFPPLDYHPGAAAAYSLRSLSSSYTGPVVTVRRSSDDAEADFTASEVAGGALAAWVGANDGFVTTWYDQSGNGNDATQATAGNQPKIVSSGTVILENGKPAIVFDGNDDRLNLPTISSQVRCDTHFVAAPSSFSGSPGSANARFFDVIAGATSFQFYRDSNTLNMAMKNSFWQTGLAASAFGTGQTGQQMYSAAFKSASNTLHIDGVSQSISGSTTAGAAGTTGAIGARADSVSSGFFEGAFQELLIYFSDVSAQRIDIEAEISQAYGI